MVRSRSATLRFWRSPWKRRLLALGEERIFPWACMGCGVVLLYLERLPVRSEEKESNRARSVAPKAQPAHFKS